MRGSMRMSHFKQHQAHIGAIDIAAVIKIRGAIRRIATRAKIQQHVANIRGIHKSAAV